MFIKAIALIAAAASIASAQHAFTYQGILNDEGVPANGNYDMRFSLWTDEAVGEPDIQIGFFSFSPVTVVTDGLFSANLEFDDASFQTQLPRYLEIQVRFPGDILYTNLAPRQQIVFVPRAIHALTADTAIESELIQLPFSGSRAPTVVNGSLFTIENTGTSGTAIFGLGPVFGVTGVAGSVPSSPPAPGPSGIFGLGQRAGVAGTTNNGAGVWGSTIQGNGGEFTVLNSNIGNALYAHTAGAGYAGIFRKSLSTGSIPTLLVENHSTSTGAFGVHSIIKPTSPGGFSAAIRGENRGTGGNGIGVYGSHAGSGWGIYGTSVSGLAGFFQGNVQVNGTLSKSGGSFKIDHPQDPENMFLSHSFVESPDMKNIYDGVIILDKFGQAVVTLPSYFNALNQTFRYQLTTIGGYAPIYIAAEIESSHDARSFAVAGGTPNLKVSWQVTGIRHDAWANKNRIPIEEYKSDSEKGKYLNPDAFNQPKESRIGYIQSP